MTFSKPIEKEKGPIYKSAPSNIVNKDNLPNCIDG